MSAESSENAPTEPSESLRARLAELTGEVARREGRPGAERLQTDVRLLRTLADSVERLSPERDADARAASLAALADGVERLARDLGVAVPVPVPAAAPTPAADQPVAIRRPQLVAATPTVAPADAPSAGTSPRMPAPAKPQPDAPAAQSKPRPGAANKPRGAGRERFQPSQPPRPRISPEERAATMSDLVGSVERFLAAEKEQLREAERQRAELQGRDPVPVDDLPVWEARAEIVDKLARHPVVLLTGETGSGKTLLAPFLAMQAGLGREGMIVQTEPRRVAARQIARRLSQMAGRKLGDAFGLQTRVDRALSRRTLCKVATDGILLNELRDDPLLSRYQLVIIDEAHERSINIDLLLGMMRRIREQRDDLRVLVASATIDEEKFARFFDLTDDQIVRVPGRLYPVEQRYHPPELDAAADADAEEDELADLPRRAALAVKRIQEEGPGDILVFMPRVREIAATIQELKRQGVRLSEIEAIPMHGSLSPDENDRVFAPMSRRKVIVATNIAETSITVPGIRWVVDSGFVNLKRYHAKSGISSLRPEWISQASAKQRLGRAGRVEDGVCIRLYEDETYERLPAFTDPEVQRTDLAHVVLYMRDLGIDNVRQFPFVDKPDGQQLNNAHRTLVELGALTAGKQRESEITPAGRKMAALPLEPSLGRMVIEAEKFGCVDEIVTIAACLSADRDPFVLPPPTADVNLDKARKTVNELRKRFSDGSSDFVALLNTFREYAQRPWRERENWCRRSFLSIRTLEEIAALRRDLIDALRDHVGQAPAPVTSVGPASVPANPVGQASAPANPVGQASVPASASGQGNAPPRGGRRLPSNGDYDAINRCVLAGHVQNVCVAAGKYDYLAVGKHTVYLHPASVYFDMTRRPPIVVARQLERGEAKIFAKDLAAVEPHWIEKVAKHLCSYVYEERRYDEKSGKALAKETIYFHDLTLVEDRAVDLAQRSPEEGLEILVRDGLLRQKFTVDPGFLRHNERVLDEAKRIALRIGDRGLVPDESDALRWYIQRLEGAGSRHQIEARARREKRLLQMRVEDFLPADLVRDAEHWYPREGRLAGQHVEIEYIDDPFNEVTQCLSTLPVTAVPRLADGELDRLVPGLARRQIEFAARLLNAALDTAHAPDVAAAGVGYDPATKATMRASGLMEGDGQPLGPDEVEQLVRDFLAPGGEAAPTAWEHVVAYVNRTRHVGSVPAAVAEAYREATQRERMYAYVEVVRADGSRLVVSHGTDELRRSVDLERLKKAWEAARAEVETAYTDRYQDIPPLLDGLMRRVEVARLPGREEPVYGWIGLDAGHAQGKIARKLFDAEDAALSHTRGALVQFGRWHLLLDPNLHMRLQQVRVPDELDHRYFAATGARDSLAGKLRQLLIRTGSDAGFTRDEIEAGQAALMPRLSALRERLPAAVAGLADALDAVLDAYDAAYQAVRLAGGPPELANPLEVETRRLRELDALGYYDLPKVRARLEALAALAGKAEPTADAAEGVAWIEAQLQRAADEAAARELDPASREALRREAPGAARDAAPSPNGQGKPATPAAPAPPRADKKRKKRSKDAPPEWVAPRPSEARRREPEPARADSAAASRPAARASDAAAISPATRTASQAGRPTKEEQQQAQRAAREAELRERTARNRAGYTQLIEASAGAEDVAAGAIALLERLAQEGQLALDRAIQWDADAASEAELQTLLELDDKVEQWVTACALAQDQVLADCRLHGEPRPATPELAERIAARALQLLG